MTKKLLYERIHMYHMTTNLPVRVYDASSNLLCHIGELNMPYAFLDDYLIDRHWDYIEESPTFYISSSDYNEHYLSLALRHSNTISYIIVVGPYKHQRPNVHKIEQHIAKKYGRVIDREKLMDCYTQIPTIKAEANVQHYAYLQMLFTDCQPIVEGKQRILTSQYKPNKILMEYREIDFYHHDYLKEIQYVHHRFKGRLSQIDKELVTTLEPAIVSVDYLRSIKNIGIVNIAISGRYAIDHGIDPHYSFSIGDAYIRKLETLKSLPDLMSLFDQVYDSYKKAVDDANQLNYSIKIKKAIQYIDKNLSIGFSLSDVARHVRMHPNYLSASFKKEVGMPYSTYILKEKIEEAKLLLDYSNNTLAEISGILNFCSKSYFVKCFKRIEGITPMNYINMK